jgi:ADP-ribose pyrophosphatase YjhB (NUDIX family)
MQPKHIAWAKRIQALAQTGLAYAENSYERERWEALRELASEMMASASDLPADECLNIFRRESGYATPKVDVRGAVFRDGKILLSRELDDGCWSLPGGWADVNDSPSQAIVREVREEAGYEVRCIRLVAVLDRDLHCAGGTHPFHIYKLMFLCEITDQVQGLCHDITDAEFFDLDELPELSLHRTLPEHIHLLHEHALNPALPTVFD